MSKSKSTKASSASTKNAEARVSSETIAEQVAAFVASGQKIEQVPQGVSGMPATPSKHIVISRKPKNQ